MTSARVHFSLPLGYCSASFKGISYVISSSSAPTEASDRTDSIDRAMNRSSQPHNRRCVDPRRHRISSIAHSSIHVPDDALGRTIRIGATEEAPAPPRRTSGASVLAACRRACRGSIPSWRSRLRLCGVQGVGRKCEMRAGEGRSRDDGKCGVRVVAVEIQQQGADSFNPAAFCIVLKCVLPTFAKRSNSLKRQSNGGRGRLVRTCDVEGLLLGESPPPAAAGVSGHHHKKAQPLASRSNRDNFS